MNQKILQCHSQGDKRYSPFCCNVKAFGENRSIENHYQSTKLFQTPKGLIQARDWREAKDWQKAINKGGFRGRQAPPKLYVQRFLRFSAKQKIGGLLTTDSR